MKKLPLKKTSKKGPLVGFVGQGWLGKNYADDFEKRGYSVIRYSLEEPHVKNRDAISTCDIVFIAVPTPTTPKGFQDHIVREALAHVGNGKIAVIRSTLMPGTLRSMQKQYPKKILMHAPEFLSRITAADDAAHPAQNIIGIARATPAYTAAAKKVLAVMPKAPSMIVSAETAELYKYVHNTSLFARSIFMNLLYEIAVGFGVDWDDIKRAIQRDPMIAFQVENVSHWHIEPRHTGGRGIGGDCHIKDIETLSRVYAQVVGDTDGTKAIDAMKRKNIHLLLQSKKDLHLLEGVYGTQVHKKILKKGSKK